jgi:hypothetical protein
MVKSLRELLDEYERDILMRIDPVRKELATLERSLADVRKARNAIVREATTSAAVAAAQFETRLMEQLRRPVFYAGGEAVAAEIVRPASPYAKLTMKQLVRKALDEHFENGATANELMDFFRNAWGRNDIVRSSLSPQLSRLKREGLITLEGKKWHLLGVEDDDPDDEPLLLTAPQEKREPI